MDQPVIVYVPVGVRHADQLRSGLVLQCEQLGLDVEVTSDLGYARRRSAEGARVVVARPEHRRLLQPDVLVLDVRVPRQRALVAAAVAWVVAWVREHRRAAAAAGLVAAVPLLLLVPAPDRDGGPGRTYSGTESTERLIVFLLRCGVPSAP